MGRMETVRCADFSATAVKRGRTSHSLDTTHSSLKIATLYNFGGESWREIQFALVERDTICSVVRDTICCLVVRDKILFCLVERDTICCLVEKLERRTILVGSDSIWVPWCQIKFFAHFVLKILDMSSLVSKVI
jgi:hypothetical protein